jgi:DNA (cytosine-5)-methyltransferase 1
VGHGQPRLVGLAPMANRNRIGRLSGYGNAIVPQVASAFIAAFMEAV